MSCRQSANISTSSHFIALVGLIATFVGIIGLGITGCGLPSIPIIDPPLNPGYDEDAFSNTPGQQVLTFEHNQKNDGDDFKGYELYYKLYPPPSSPVSSSLESDENYIESTPRDSGVGRLQARGFRRLVAVTDRDGDPNTIDEYIRLNAPPHLPIKPTGSSIVFTIDLRSPTNRPDGSPDKADSAVTEIVVSSENHSLVRGFRRSSGVDDYRFDAFSSIPWDEYEGFWDFTKYNAEDADIYSSLYDNGTFNLGEFDGQLVIILYAVTYATDATTFRPYYSVPLRLEEATIVVPEN